MVTKIENSASPTPSFSSFFVWVIFSSPPLQLCREGFCNSSFRISSLSRFSSSHLNYLITEKGVTTSALQRLHRVCLPASRDGPARLRRLLCFLPPGGACSCSPQRPKAAASFLGMLSFSVPRSTEITAPPVGSRLGGQSDSLWPRTKGSETLKGPQGQQHLDNKIRPGVWGAGTWNTA